MEKTEEVEESSASTIITGKSGVAKHIVTVDADLRADQVTEKSYHEDVDINEGVTDWLTGKVFDEYINRTGESEVRSAEESASIEGIRGAYWLEQTNVELYIYFLSELSKQPTSVIENAIIRTYLRNGEIVPDDLYDLLSLPESGREKILGLLKDYINSSEFEGTLQTFKKFLPEEKQTAFAATVTAAYDRLHDARNKLSDI